MGARHHHDRLPKRYANAASMRGLQSALSALYGPAVVLTDAENMAERERMRIEAESQKQRQGVLSLPVRENT